MNEHFIKALRIYNLLEDHLSEYKKGDSVPGYLLKVVRHFIDSGKSDEFTKIILEIKPMSDEELQQLSPEEVTSLFIKGLEDYKIFELKSFLGGLGYGGRKSK